MNSQSKEFYMPQKQNLQNVNDITLPEFPWNNTVDEISKKLNVNPDRGLTKNDIKKRKRQFGYNRLKKIERKSIWSIFISQIKSILVILLISASIISFIFGRTLDGIAILVVVIINTLIGFFTELKATRSMEALYELTKVKAKVRRDGDIMEIRAKEIVPGDIILLNPGDIVSADARLIKANKLKADESSLTGESVPVEKNTEKKNKDLILAERSNMIFKGTAITRGEAEGVVIATGTDTELGKISSLVRKAAKSEKTPLEKRIQKLGQNLIWVTLIIVVIVAISGILRGRDIYVMIETSIALAVAAVPEGLPIVLTIALASGMRLMAKNNALVNRLSSVEVLGSTNVICTDKTGTLTENRMTAAKYIIPTGEINVSGTGLTLDGEFSLNNESINPMENSNLWNILKIGVLCNNASLAEDFSETEEFFGEPTEIALLIAGKKADLKKSELLNKYPEDREVSFDTKTNMMATYNRNGDNYLVMVKGAPDAVINSSNIILKDKNEEKFEKEEKKLWIEKNNKMATNGLRVLAFAIKEVEDIKSEPYSNLIFLGLVGLLDPPRKGVSQSILKCEKAGIKVVMVTGDQSKTALNIAKQVSIIQNEEEKALEGKSLAKLEDLSNKEKEDIRNTRVFSRVSPEQKLNLIDVHQENGSVVAMTGDGVNDAPALEKSDIGIAMGQRGTQVAKEAADIILKDDNFETITYAVEEGRTIFTNIRKFVIYLLSCNISEILILLIVSFMDVPLPLLPLQILYLNIVTDVFPALALSKCKGDEDIMKRPPRDPNEPVMTNKIIMSIILYSNLITLSVVSSYLLAYLVLELSVEKSITVAFITLAFAQLWHVFNIRRKGTKFLRNEITLNKYIWFAIIFCIFLILLAIYLIPLSILLETEDPGFNGWILIMIMSSIPFFIGQIWNSLGFEIDDQIFNINLKNILTKSKSNKKS
jgi:Ca2+-transporting ATPase